MKVAVFTTDTLHHLRFIQALSEQHEITEVFFETKTYSAPFPTFHIFEKEREQFESDYWFNGEPPEYKDFCNTSFTFSDLNQVDPISKLEDLKADIAVVFGTGKLSKTFIDHCRVPLINLHGGDPELYRGLDTHLWAIYHNDFTSIKTCLHFIEPTLDTGDIIGLQQLNITHNMSLKELRSENTQVCIDLVNNALSEFSNNSSITRRKQNQKGRYYSFMPDVLKEICVHKFLRHTSKIS